ncbi:MAG: hypothetical protein LBN96_07720 [Desulfovibrio sp.]|jgi:hypothetical protein|nr:hypothetical protein [Desulfovibrio sp.]
MNSDIRLAVSFRGHRKRKRLRLLLGPGSTDYLIDLWIATAMTHPSGILQGMDETDIALEAGWDGNEPDKLVSALVECGFLEKDENGVYSLHDWSDHQGYAIHAERRKAHARNAAAARWNSRLEKDLQDACSRHAEGNPLSPLPSPVPSPIPVPEPVPVPVHSSQPVPATGNAEQQREKPVPASADDSEAYKLAVLMRDTLKANVPTLKEPNLAKWAQSLAVALRNDERMAEASFVAEVIKWACSDSFWRANIQSPDKLRQKFDQLTAKMETEAEKARTASKEGTWVSPAQRRVEANRAACEEAKRLLFGDTAPAEEALTYDAS